MIPVAPLLEFRNVATFPAARRYRPRGCEWSEPDRRRRGVRRAGGGERLRQIDAGPVGASPVSAGFGEVLYRGQSIAEMTAGQLQQFRQAIQPVFQDTTATFNPRRPVRDVAAPGPASGPGVSSRRSTIGHDNCSRACGCPPAVRSSTGTRTSSAAVSGSVWRSPVPSPWSQHSSSPTSHCPAPISIRGQILNLLVDLQRERRVAYLFITHDLSIARAFAQRAAVIYRGMVVEEGATAEVLRRPAHPYTQLLLASAPDLDGRVDLARVTTVRREASRGAGCVFWPRCPVALEVCQHTAPQLTGTSLPPGHRAACHLIGDKAPARCD